MNRRNLADGLVSDVAGGVVFSGTVTPHDLESGRLVTGTAGPATAAPGPKIGLMFFDVPEEAARAQAFQLYENLTALLGARGLTLGNIVRQRLFLTDVRDLAAIERVMDAVLAGPLPATSVIVVPDHLMDPEIKVYLDVVAAADRGWARDGHALGSGDRRYPDAIRCGDLLFVSAIDGLPAAGEAAAVAPPSLLRTDRERQAFDETIRTFERLAEILKDAGSDIAGVLKVNGWVRLPMREYGSVVLARNEYFDSSERTMMASTGLQVAGVGSAEALLAFDAIALADRSAGKKVTGAASAISSPYVAGAAAGGGLVITSGEIPVDIGDQRVLAATTGLSPAGRLLRFGRLDAESGFEARAFKVYEVLAAHLAAAGRAFRDVVHQTVFTTDPQLVLELEMVARRFFGGEQPPTTVIPIVSTTPFPAARLEIELVASG
ncbi:Rid family hydrolase [Actinomadura macra]|uniref:Rid family hydrolase n=1 Tax=Actinomadura macra TaxID=46164 RepID=UPI000AF22219|nr:Rid family hydrolase [Actinomadura macra]